MKRKSNKEIEEMRKRFRKGTSAAVLAEETGYSLAHVYDIVNGHARKDAGGPVKEESAWLSDRQREEIRALDAAGVPQKVIARRYGRSQGTISGVITGNMRKKRRT